MSSLITPTQFKEHVETDLGDDALQRIIDSEEQDIIERYGAHAIQTESFEPAVDTKYVYPSRKILSVSSVIERIGTTDTTIETDDYEIVNNRRVDRLATGTNPQTYWGDRVTMTYVPTDDNAKRTRVLIDLCKLTLQYNALKSETSGDYQASYAAYQSERLSILSALGGRWWA